MARSAVLLAVGALALAGCNSDDGGGEELTWEDSPLNQAFEGLSGVGEQSSEEWEAEYEDQQRRIEELIATCMADQGFEYIPMNYADMGIDTSDLDGEFDPASREYAEQYGYGITTMDEIVGSDPAQEPEDPNQAIYDAMSDSEQAAYEAALYGDFDVSAAMDMDDDEFEMPDASQTGCTGQAEAAVRGTAEEEATVDNLSQDPRFAEFFEAEELFYTTAENDPSFDELEAEWSSCMAEAGYDGFANSNAAADSIFEEMNALWDATGDEEGVEPDEAEMARLREIEITLAVADWDCSDQIDLQQRRMAIQFELEQAFVDEWQEEIDTLVAAYNEQVSDDS
ncbi:MAG: hypothetical protein ACK5KU_10295 [Beutenbergiaceae bacterium]